MCVFQRLSGSRKEFLQLIEYYAFKILTSNELSDIELLQLRKTSFPYKLKYR